MVEGASAPDEWVQEAVVSDSFQREPDRKNKTNKQKASKKKPNTLRLFIIIKNPIFDNLKISFSFCNYIIRIISK